MQLVFRKCNHFCKTKKEETLLLSNWSNYTMPLIARHMYWQLLKNQLHTGFLKIEEHEETYRNEDNKKKHKAAERNHIRTSIWTSEFADRHESIVHAKLKFKFEETELSDRSNPNLNYATVDVRRWFLVIHASRESPTCDLQWLDYICAAVRETNSCKNCNMRSQ